MSTKFSKSRATLPRPRVCHPPLPHLPPIQDLVCKVIPTSIEIQVPGVTGWIIFTWDSTLPDQDPVGMDVTTQFSTIVERIEPVNEENFTGQVVAENPFQIGLETIIFIFAFSNGRTCAENVTVNWVAI